MRDSPLLPGVAGLLGVTLLSGCWVTDAELLEWAGDSGSAPSSDDGHGGASGSGSIALGDAVGLAITSPHGLTWHSGELWVGDWSSSQLYTVDPSSGDVTARVDLLGENPRDLTSSGGTLWVVTTAGELLAVDTSAEDFEVHDGDADWTGLGFDGTYLLASDPEASLSFVRTDSVATQYTLSLTGGDGPALVDGGAFVVASASGSRLTLTAFDATQAATANELGSDTASGLQSTDITGFATSGSTAWVVGSGGLSSATLTEVDLSNPPW